MKVNRQAQIVKIIQNSEIKTQAEIAQLLHLKGHTVTQATISRDIRDLKLSKTAKGDKLFYTRLIPAELEGNNRLINICADGITEIDHASNIIIIKTLPGLAMGVAACVDALSHTWAFGNDLIGTVAGDDCIIGVVKTIESASNISNCLKELLFQTKN